jgi:hypothetical protein
MLGRDDPVGTIQSVEHTLRNPDTLAGDQQSRMTRIQKELLDYRAESKRPFEHGKQLKQLPAPEDELNSAPQPGKGDQQGSDSAPELRDHLEVGQNPTPAQTSREQVAMMAEAYMRASKTAIVELPISQRTPPQTGPVTGRAVAKDDSHIAVGTGANSFFVIPSTCLGREVQIGECVSLRFQLGLPSLEDDYTHSR